jgi:hypothetical protein
MTGPQGFLEFLWKERSSRVLYCISALLGLAYALWLFDLRFLLGTSAYWQTIVGDPAQHVAGYYYYIQDEWRFPIFLTRNYGYPDGVSIIFTDSLPAISLIVKSLRGLLPNDFNVFGPWLAACYVLQGVGITALVAALGYRSIATTAAATLLALSLPSFLVRVEVASLPAQFLLTFALALYFHLVRGTRPGPTMWWFSALTLFSLLIHPYLFAMVFAVFTAAVAQRVLDHPGWWSSACRYSAAMVVAVVVTMFAAGYIGSGIEGGTPSGLGDPLNALDVLAPVLPEGSGLIPSRHDIAAFGADYHNYLGIGLLLLVTVHLLGSGRAAVEGIKRHPVLSLLLAGFAVFAMSNIIRFAGAEVMSYGLPRPARWLFGQFRATARFFWPVTYMLLAGGVALTAQRFRRPAGTLLLSGAIVLQLLDTAPVRATVTRYSQGGAFEQAPLNHATWNRLISNHDSVQVFPSFPCRPWEETDSRNFDMALQLLAAKRNVPINSLYISGNRSRSTKDCTEERGSVFDLKPTQRDLLVFLRDHYSSSVVRRLFGDTACRRFALGYVCTLQWNAVAPDLGLSAFPSLEGPRYYRLGSPIDFRSGGDSRDYLAGGWLMPEPSGSGLDGPNAYIDLPLAEPLSGAGLSLVVETSPVDFGRRAPVVDVHVLLNGTVVGDMRVDARRSETHAISVPTTLIRDRSNLLLQLRAANLPNQGRQRNSRLDIGVRSITVATGN